MSPSNLIMNNDSKKRQNLKKQIENRAQIAKIEHVEKVLKYLSSPKNFDLIEHTTTLSSDKESEDRKFIISFNYFNWRACNFEQFNPAKGKKLIEILEQVSKCSINKFPELKLIRDSIGNVAPYESLFQTLTPEVSKINETEFCEGRLFFFITEPYFNIISVETKHRNN